MEPLKKFLKDIPSLTSKLGKLYHHTVNYKKAVQQIALKTASLKLVEQAIPEAIKKVPDVVKNVNTFYGLQIPLSKSLEVSTYVVAHAAHKAVKMTALTIQNNETHGIKEFLINRILKNPFLYHVGIKTFAASHPVAAKIVGWSGNCGLVFYAIKFQAWVFSWGE